MNKISVVTQTQIATYRNCPKKFFWRYIAGLVPYGNEKNKEMGTAIHAALEQLFLTGDIALAESKLNEWSSLAGEYALEPTDFAKIRGVLAGYWKKWGNPRDRYQVIKVEKQFSFKVPNTNGIRIEGKIDALVKDTHTNRIQLWDHKTASRMDTNYVLKRWMDLQLNTYAIGAAEDLGIVIDEYVYDVMQKPNIRLKVKETPEQFAERCVAECTEENYERIIYPRCELRMDETRRQIGGWVGHMLISEATGFYGENTDKCFDNYGHNCEYWDLCCSNDNPVVRDNGYKVEVANPELQVDAESGGIE